MWTIFAVFEAEQKILQKSGNEDNLPIWEVWLRTEDFLPWSINNACLQESIKEQYVFGC